MNNVADNISALRREIEALAVAAGRAVQSVQLVAVSKTQPDERIESALAAGQRVFGENRVQEARERWDRGHPSRRERFSDLCLHLIGPLQGNKVRDAVALFDVIETVDRPDIARKLAAEMARQQRPLPCFIQVNTGGEAQKAGVAVRDADSFVDFCRAECGLLIEGLMCIPPLDDDPVPHFRMLRTLAREKNLRSLSMGMSGDFHDAIKEGATHVRIGTALFGGR
jgi:pyridoxal phosphate enzyme (YggS family)